MSGQLVSKQLYYDAGQLKEDRADPNRFLGTYQRGIEGLVAAELKWGCFPHSWENVSTAVGTNYFTLHFNGQDYDLSITDGNYDCITFATALKTALDSVLLIPGASAHASTKFTVTYDSNQNAILLQRLVDGESFNFPGYDDPLSAPRFYNLLGIDWATGWTPTHVPNLLGGYLGYSGFTGFVDLQPIKSIQIAHSKLEHNIEYANGILGAFTFTVPVNSNFGGFTTYSHETGPRNVAQFSSFGQNLSNFDVSIFDERGRPIDFQGGQPKFLIEYLCSNSGYRVPYQHISGIRNFNQFNY